MKFVNMLVTSLVNTCEKSIECHGFIRRQRELLFFWHNRWSNASLYIAVIANGNVKMMVWLNQEKPYLRWHQNQAITNLISFIMITNLFFGLWQLQKMEHVEHIQIHHGKKLQDLKKHSSGMKSEVLRVKWERMGLFTNSSISKLQSVFS